jgi:hypothetical protein
MPRDFAGRRSIVIAAAVNNEEVLRDNLGASPVLQEAGLALVTERGHDSAGRAYNHALDRTDAEIVVFAHQDVYLPGGWLGRLQTAIEALEARQENWAVLGIVGVDRGGALVGRSWSNGLHLEIDTHLTAPTAVQAVDELVIVLRRTSGLWFDAQLPGFHLYGTDIVQAALAAGFGAYVFDGPVVHNSLPVTRLDGSYCRAYRHMQRKWRGRLPIKTTVVPITRWGWPLLSWQVRRRIRSLRERPATERCASPAGVARELGYE